METAIIIYLSSNIVVDNFSPTVGVHFSFLRCCCCYYIITTVVNRVYTLFLRQDIIIVFNLPFIILLLYTLHTDYKVH